MTKRRPRVANNIIFSNKHRDGNQGSSTTTEPVASQGGPQSDGGHQGRALTQVPPQPKAPCMTTATDAELKAFFNTPMPTQTGTCSTMGWAPTHPHQHHRSQSTAAPTTRSHLSATPSAPHLPQTPHGSKPSDAPISTPRRHHDTDTSTGHGSGSTVEYSPQWGLWEEAERNACSSTSRTTTHGGEDHHLGATSLHHHRGPLPSANEHLALGSDSPRPEVARELSSRPTRSAS